MHKDESMDQHHTWLMNSLRHEASHIIQLKPLSGPIAGIDGQLQVNSDTFLYKIHESGFSLFTRGNT